MKNPGVRSVLCALACMVVLGGNLAASDSNLVGVWMGYHNYKLDSPRWIKFYGNGSLFWDLPTRGFLGFNHKASRADPNQKGLWGTYTVSGASGQIHKPGVDATWKLSILDDSKIKIDTDTYYRCAEVDGAKLAGSWSTYGGGEESVLSSIKGLKPVIVFSPDGHFTDHGILSFSYLSQNKPAANSANAPGRGTYEAKAFSLILHYAGGRTRQLSFTFSLNSKQPEKVIYLERAALFKR